MSRIRRGGYIFISWIGDHRPRHVHVYDDDANFITRMNLETMQPIDVLKVDKKGSVLFAICKARGGCEGDKKREGAVWNS